MGAHARSSVRGARAGLWRLVWLSLCLVAGLAAAWWLLGHELLNVGLLHLERAFGAQRAWTDPLPDPAAARPAEDLLRYATVLLPGDRSAQRGLAFALAAEGREPEARTLWAKVGGLADEFAQYAEAARESERYGEAAVWYERAASVAPETGEYWYSAGSMHERLGDWGAALDALRRAAIAATPPERGRSSAYYRLGFIYHWRMDPPQLEPALAAYDAAVALHDFRDGREEADSHYERGEIYARLGQDLQVSIDEYREAIALDPGHAWAHLRLGAALYRLNGDLAAAEDEIAQALALWPEDASRKWPYHFLGEIYRAAGLTDKAIAAYRDVLRFDPQDERAQAALRELEQP